MREIRTYGSKRGQGSNSLVYLPTHINSIGTSVGTESDHIYRYDDPGFSLDEVFKNIANDIMADFWLVSGPVIKK
jgi:hypothetical protein